MASLKNLSVIAALSGQGLTVEESAALEVGMRRRSNEEGLTCWYWGKITGTDNDYLVVIGHGPGKGCVSKKFFFCTSNNLVLQEMPSLSSEFAGKAAAVQGRFKGDPSLLLDGDEEDEDKGDDEDEEGAVRAPKFSEMHRVAYTVNAIENDTAVVPRGCGVIDATLSIRPNAGFRGLSFAEAGSLDNYQHLRPSATADLEAAATGAKASDFLDRLSDDEPRGVWALRVDAAQKRSTIRSLKWPGYFFFHELGSNNFAGVYTGNGLANGDLGFML